jgi:Holliday junction resolvasome RuvABC endonuclease subunit
MIVVGIDPGATFGWAVIELPGDRALAGGQGSRKKRGDAMDRIARYAATIAAVEDQFVIDDRKMSFRERRGKQVSSIKLAHDAGEWGMWLAMHGCSMQYVQPRQWRRASRGSDWSQKAAKRTAVGLAGLFFDLEIPDSQHHFAEALLIARWAGVEAIHRARCAPKG